jgi:hypothetical protein
MSLSDPGNLSNALNFATLANPARAFYGAASTPSSGVSQIVAGSGITVSPAGGTGVVTVSASGSSGVVGMASNARKPYNQLVERVPDFNPVNGVNGVVGVTCPVGNVTTGGYVTFSFYIRNSESTDSQVKVGIFTGPNTPPINVIDQIATIQPIPALGSGMLISRTFPLVNMTGNFVVQGFVIQSGAPTQGLTVYDPSISVTWGGIATIEAPPP